MERVTPNAGNKIIAIAGKGNKAGSLHGTARRRRIRLARVDGAAVTRIHRHPHAAADCRCESCLDVERSSGRDKHCKRQNQRERDPAEHQQNINTRSSCRRLLAAAVFTAIAFLFVVHRTILAALFAALFLSRKRAGANHRRENRHQHCGYEFHWD